MRSPLFLKLYFVFALTAVFIIILGTSFFKETLDVQLYDTYFVIPQQFLVVVFAVICLIFSIIYFAFDQLKKPLGSKLGYLHYLFVLVTFVIALLKPSVDLNVSGTRIVSAVVIFFLGQIILVINVFRVLRSGK